jgi:hypothetical protein
MPISIDQDKYVQFLILRPDRVPVFLSRIAQRGPDECWLWIGAKGKDGYGAYQYSHPSFSKRRHHHSECGNQWYSRTKDLLPYIEAYYLLTGNLPSPPYVLDHLCRNKLCCNPRHLEIATNQVNVYRGLHLQIVGPNPLLPNQGVYPPGATPLPQPPWNPIVTP